VDRILVSELGDPDGLARKIASGVRPVGSKIALESLLSDPDPPSCPCPLLMRITIMLLGG